MNGMIRRCGPRWYWFFANLVFVKKWVFFVFFAMNSMIRRCGPRWYWFFANLVLVKKWFFLFFLLWSMKDMRRRCKTKYETYEGKKTCSGCSVLACIVVCMDRFCSIYTKAFACICIYMPFIAKKTKKNYIHMYKRFCIYMYIYTKGFCICMYIYTKGFAYMCVCVCVCVYIYNI